MGAKDEPERRHFCQIVLSCARLNTTNQLTSFWCSSCRGCSTPPPWYCMCQSIVPNGAIVPQMEPKSASSCKTCVLSMPYARCGRFFNIYFAMLPMLPLIAAPLGCIHRVGVYCLPVFACQLSKYPTTGCRHCMCSRVCASHAFWRHFLMEEVKFFCSCICVFVLDQCLQQLLLVTVG